MRQSPCDRCCHHPFQTEVDSSVTVLHNLQDTFSRFQFVSQLVSPSDVKKKEKGYVEYLHTWCDPVSSNSLLQMSDGVPFLFTA